MHGPLNVKYGKGVATQEVKHKSFNAWFNKMKQGLWHKEFFDKYLILENIQSWITCVTWMDL
jgi:hypothetical protein